MPKSFEKIGAEDFETVPLIRATRLGLEAKLKIEKICGPRRGVDEPDRMLKSVLQDARALVDQQGG